MNEKIPLRTFAEKVAETTGRSEAEMESLIRRLFELIAEGLHEGRKVEVKGLGTFSLSDNPADPVDFYPASSWAERVNAPFAMFTPEELAPDASESDFNEIDSIAEEESDTPDPLPQDDQSADGTATEPVVGPAAADNLTEETKAAAHQSDAASEVEVIESVETTDVPDESSDDRVIEAPAATEETFLSSPEADSYVDNQDDHDEAVVTSDNDAERATEDAPEKNGFGRGFIAGLIVGLAIGALGLCCYVMYFVHASGETQPVETELVESTPLQVE